MRPISVIFPYLPTEFHCKRDAARDALHAIFAKVRCTLLTHCPARGLQLCGEEGCRKPRYRCLSGTVWQAACVVRDGSCMGFRPGGGGRGGMPTNGGPPPLRAGHQLAPCQRRQGRRHAAGGWVGVVRGRTTGEAAVLRLCCRCCIAAAACGACGRPGLQGSNWLGGASLHAHPWRAHLTLPRPHALTHTCPNFPPRPNIAPRIHLLYCCCTGADGLSVQERVRRPRHHRRGEGGREGGRARAAACTCGSFARRRSSGG